MRYRTDEEYHHDERQNESRADQLEHALAIVSDCNGEDEDQGVFTDLSDLLAHVRHFCDRAGIDFGEVDSHAYRAYSGDREDGPPCIRDAVRFPAGVIV